MRTIKEIDNDLMEARAALAHVEGRPAEVYSRIVGYYRSVRNWNKGKKEEYLQRSVFDVARSLSHNAARPTTQPTPQSETTTARWNTPACTTSVQDNAAGEVLLFVRPGCPNCPPAKHAAAGLGVPVETVDAGTDAGLAAAKRWTVMSTPTAILLSKTGKELARAQDGASIVKFRVYLADTRKSA
jgi:ribonucleoside-triphosphate reductase